MSNLQYAATAPYRRLYSQGNVEHHEDPFVKAVSITQAQTGLVS